MTDNATEPTGMLARSNALRRTHNDLNAIRRDLAKLYTDLLKIQSPIWNFKLDFNDDLLAVDSGSNGDTTYSSSSSLADLSNLNSSNLDDLNSDLSLSLGISQDEASSGVAPARLRFPELFPPEDPSNDGNSDNLDGSVTLPPDDSGTNSRLPLNLVNPPEWGSDHIGATSQSGIPLRRSGDQVTDTNLTASTSDNIAALSNSPNHVNSSTGVLVFDFTEPGLDIRIEPSTQRPTTDLASTTDHESRNFPSTPGDTVVFDDPDFSPIVQPMAHIVSNLDHIMENQNASESNLELDENLEAAPPYFDYASFYVPSVNINVPINITNETSSISQESPHENAGMNNQNPNSDLNNPISELNSNANNSSIRSQTETRPVVGRRHEDNNTVADSSILRPIRPLLTSAIDRFEYSRDEVDNNARIDLTSHGSSSDRTFQNSEFNSNPTIRHTNRSTGHLPLPTNRLRLADMPSVPSGFISSSQNSYSSRGNLRSGITPHSYYFRGSGDFRNVDTSYRRDPSYIDYTSPRFSRVGLNTYRANDAFEDALDVTNYRINSFVNELDHERELLILNGGAVSRLNQSSNNGQNDSQINGRLSSRYNSNDPRENNRVTDREHNRDMYGSRGSVLRSMEQVLNAHRSSRSAISYIREGLDSRSNLFETGLGVRDPDYTPNTSSTTPSKKAFRSSNALDDSMNDLIKSRKSGEIWKKSKNSSKRASTSTGSFVPNKRQKKHKSHDEDTVMYNQNNYKYHFLDNLSEEKKDSILDIQFCSLLKSGTCFELSLNEHKNIKELMRFNCFDLKFLEVNYKSKSLLSTINLTAVSKDLYKKVTLFKLFLFGQFNTMSRHKSFFKKINLLEQLSREKNLEFSNSFSNINLLASGKLIDFKNNDLRYLQTDNLKTASSAIRGGIVRTQLNEWLNIEPFCHFNQAYLISHLEKLNSSLKMVENSKIEESHKLELIRNARLLRWNYEDFGALSSQPLDTKTNNPFTKRVIDKFVDTWREIKVDSLGDQITKSITTLLNIQLNYILFTIEIDLNDFLDNSINFIIKDCLTQDYSKKYQTIYDDIIKDEKDFKEDQDSKNSNKATLLCSLNRKTGELQVHNTLDFMSTRKTSRSRFILRRRRRGFPLPEDDDIANDFESAGHDIEESYAFAPMNDEWKSEQYLPTELYGKLKRNGELGGHPAIDSV